MGQLARVVLERTITLNFTAEEMQKLGLKEPALTIERGRATHVPVELLDHWVVKPLIKGEPLKADDDAKVGAVPGVPVQGDAGNDALAEAGKKIDALNGQVSSLTADLVAANAKVEELTEKLASFNDNAAKAQPESEELKVEETKVTAVEPAAENKEPAATETKVAEA
jgi:uncharacterized coiled-coil protein SlyX